MHLSVCTDYKACCYEWKTRMPLCALVSNRLGGKGAFLVGVFCCDERPPVESSGCSSPSSSARQFRILFSFCASFSADSSPETRLSDTHGTKLSIVVRSNATISLFPSCHQNTSSSKPNSVLRVMRSLLVALSHATKRSTMLSGISSHDGVLTSIDDVLCKRTTSRSERCHWGESNSRFWSHNPVSSPLDDSDASSKRSLGPKERPKTQAVPRAVRLAACMLHKACPLPLGSLESTRELSTSHEHTRKAIDKGQWWQC